jgi:hypothetical protein
VGLDDDYYHDWPPHADDLELTFTVAGIGSVRAMDITVSASREIKATCISALGEFDSNEVVPIKFSDGESPGDPSLSYSPEDGGRLTGTVQIITDVETDVCPAYDPRSEDHGVVVYLLKDYSLTYADITVIDHKNAISTSIARAEPGYSYEGYGLNLAVEEGFSGTSLHCGVDENAGGAHCGFDNYQ